MNQKPTPERLAYRQKQLAELEKVLPALGPEIRRTEDLPEDALLAEQHAAAAATRIRKNPTPEQTHAKRTPDKLPDPWLFDSESLLRELDRCRELVLQIPIADHHATHFGINVAIDALWNLRETLRELLRIHREGQRAFAKQNIEAEHKQQKKTAAQASSKIVRMKA